LPEHLSELRSLKEPAVVEPAAAPEEVRAQVQVQVQVLAVVPLVVPVVPLVAPVLLELPVLLAVLVQAPVALRRLAPQPVNRDRADKAASRQPACGHVTLDDTSFTCQSLDSLVNHLRDS
jgi:hypothetical protein